jgi:hypothetical protein
VVPAASTSPTARREPIRDRGVVERVRGDDEPQQRLAGAGEDRCVGMDLTAVQCHSAGFVERRDGLGERVLDMVGRATAGRRRVNLGKSAPSTRSPAATLVRAGRLIFSLITPAAVLCLCGAGSPHAGGGGAIGGDPGSLDSRVMTTPDFGGIVGSGADAAVAVDGDITAAVADADGHAVPPECSWPYWRVRCKSKKGVVWNTSGDTAHLSELHGSWSLCRTAACFTSRTPISRSATAWRVGHRIATSGAAEGVRGDAERAAVAEPSRVPAKVAGTPAVVVSSCRCPPDASASRGTGGTSRPAPSPLP